MKPGSVVRVLEDRLYGYGPIGSIEETRGDWARVLLDEPERFNRKHSWFLLSELEEVDISKWEEAIRRDVA